MYLRNEWLYRIGKREINDLTHRIKEVHSPHIKNIDPITNDMIHLLHHDKELSSVYNKKTVLKHHYAKYMFMSINLKNINIITLLKLKSAISILINAYLKRIVQKNGLIAVENHVNIHVQYSKSIIDVMFRAFTCIWGS